MVTNSAGEKKGWYGVEISMNDAEGTPAFEQRLDIFINLADTNENPSLNFMNIDRYINEDAPVHSTATSSDASKTTVQLIDDEVYSGVLHSDTRIQSANLYVRPQFKSW